MNTKQMARFCNAVMQYPGFDITNPSETRRCLIELRDRLNVEKYVDLTYIDPKDDSWEFGKLRPQQGEVIAGLLGFSYEGDVQE